MYKDFEFVASNPAPVRQQRHRPDAFNFTQFATDFPIWRAQHDIADWGGQLGLPAGSVTGWVVPDVQKFIAAWACCAIAPTNMAISLWP